MADMISVATGFQSSVNIAYDINDEAKLKNYIPTKSALKLLEDILLSTGKESTDRARILIGAYGKGKSHIVLMILSILMKKDITLFEKLIPVIEKKTRVVSADQELLCRQRENSSSCDFWKQQLPCTGFSSRASAHPCGK